MRPRVFPAEDSILSTLVTGSCSGFNEAAGIPRGRRQSVQEHRAVDQASMRPRVFPAEDAAKAARRWHGAMLQ